MSEDTVAETTVQGRIIKTRGDGEAVVFEVSLGLVKLVAIANIPDEGEDTAPVYVKIRASNPVGKPGRKRRKDRKKDPAQM